MNGRLAPVRFKYLLGEILLTSWRPSLWTIQPPSADASAWPQAADVPPDQLPADAVGYCCRQTALDRFPVGVTRFGPWLCYVPRRERLYFVKLSGNFAGYLGLRSAKSRYNLKRSVKQFQDRNLTPILEVFSAPEEMAGFHQTAATISRQTYQSQLLHSGLPDSASFRASMEEKARQGEARGYVLKDQGEAIAFAWCTSKGTRLTYDVIGYLPQHAQSSPGTVLLYLILEDLFRLGRFEIFDFGIGEAAYKSAFATDQLNFSDAYLFRNSLRHRLLVSLHWNSERFSAAVGAWLERKGLKKKIRALIRRLGHAGASTTS